MENDAKLIIKVLGKKMHLSVYENRVVLSKGRWRYYHSAWYSKILEVQFREPSYDHTGFIKVLTHNKLCDFITYKTHKNDTSEQIKALKDNMNFAISEIEMRIRNSLKLPKDAQVIVRF